MLCEWLANHPEYQFCGESIERYLKDENMAATLIELETGILYPIAIDSGRRGK